MRYIFSVVLFVIATFSSWAEYEHILSYHSDLEVQTNSDLIVTEKIRIYADGGLINHGIYRDLPLSYRYRGGNVKVGFELLGVWKDGKPEKYHTDWLENGIRIYAGDEDVWLATGYYDYVFKYKVDHVLGYFNDYDELYWNVNGVGWGFVIDTLSATVYFPRKAELKQFTGYTGRFGETGNDFVSSPDGNSVSFGSTRAFYYSENLTVAVAWSKGHVEYPGTADSILFFIESYILWILAGFGFLVGLIYNIIGWLKYGKDPKPGLIVPKFYPPEGISPAETLFFKKSGNTDDLMFTAQLIGLAVKKYINIESKGTEDDPIYIITRNDDESQKGELNSTEILFHNALLGDKDILIISDKYNPRVRLAYDKLMEFVSEKYDESYFHRNAFMKGTQFIVPLLFFVLGIIAYNLYGGYFGISVVGLIAHCILNFVFMKLYERPTAQGRKIMDDVLGFEMYMKYAEKLRIKAVNPPTMDFTYFEQNLAFAVALGIAEEWKNHFDLNLVNEGYNTRMSYMRGVNLSHMTTFSSNLSSAISSASTPPSSSGSGSGGGGFSGGGGGGGGGGGW